MTVQFRLYEKHLALKKYLLVGFKLKNNGEQGQCQHPMGLEEDMVIQSEDNTGLD